MTDEEYELLDELYFVQSFSDLERALPQWDLAILTEILAHLIAQGWVRCLSPSREQTIALPHLASLEDYRQYHYLATKEGLMAHNTR